MDTLDEFTLDELRALLAIKERRASIVQADVKLNVQVQHLRTVISIRMVARDLRLELAEARVDGEAAA